MRQTRQLIKHATALQFLLTFWVIAGAQVQAATASADEWQGVISVEQTLRSSAGVTNEDHAELERLATLLEARLREARASQSTAPPTVARVLKEDIGFFESELERVVIARGGELVLGRTEYLVKNRRLLVASDGLRLDLDRAHQRGTGYVGGVAHPVPLLAIPEAVDLTGKPDGATAFDRATKRTEIREGGRVWQVDVIVGLPNPWALGLLATQQESDLFRALATLPGLPVTIEETQGEAVRRMRVVKLEARALPDALFAPDAAGPVIPER